MIAELLSSPMGVPIAACALALALIVVGMLGHALRLWDLNGGPDRGTGPVRPPARPARPRVTRPDPVRELEDDATEALRVSAERLDRGDPDLEPSPVDLDALDRKDAA